MESTGIRLFGKKITCYETLTNTPVFTTVAGEELSDYSNPNEDVEQDTRKTETELKKPDTILPCPRCKSMDTKFCYYNNYNVKQPRHFCKSCQRYWTAGGTMRTMPVGAGRRRNKNPMTHCRFQDSQINVSNGIPPKLLSFGMDFPHVDKENGDECSSGSTSNSVSEKTQDRNGFHCFPPGASWSYNPWNSGMPMPIYPCPYWNYIPSWLHLSSPTSVLGKQSREPEFIEPKKHKHSVLIPKTLRIDEAAKSSIWSTLGINNENISTRGLFKDFQTKGEEHKRHLVNPILQANPAALSRSLCFQERA